MRERKRIGRILVKLSRLWKRYPDQRLGQLLSNYVLGEIGFPAWIYEDITLERKLDDLLKAKTNKKKVL